MSGVAMRIVTLSSVYPNAAQPTLGIFVRERMQRVAQRLEGLRIVAPVPFFPADPVVRALRKTYRPAVPGLVESENGLVMHPPFFCVPGVLKSLDPLFYAASVFPALKRVRRRFPFQLIDAHFTYPDGVAACLLARRFRVPFTITLRGTEVPHARMWSKRVQMGLALKKADAVIAVSRSLGRLAQDLGAPFQRIHVIPNGVDTRRFRPMPRDAARRRLGVPAQTRVLLTVGALVRRKGIHRVLEVLPHVVSHHPDLLYVVVGGASVEGDMSAELTEMVTKRNLWDHVRLEGPRPPEALPAYYAAADLFVLPSTNEGWANVLMESLACGTPVVATDVGGNREVVCRPFLGTIIPPNEPKALVHAIVEGLERPWPRDRIAAHAAARDWDRVAEEVVGVFFEAMERRRTLPGAEASL